MQTQGTILMEAPIYIIEDEPDIGDLIKFHVQREGFTCRVMKSGRAGLDKIKHERPRLIILDLMLPDVDGLEICRQLKWDEATRSIPIIIVSAKGEEADIVAGLELGADDYVTKPFSPKVLMARLRHVLRRYERAADPGGNGKNISIAGGAVSIDLNRHAVTVLGEEIELTRTEFVILHCLAARPGFVRTRDQIITAMHGGQAVLTSRTVDVHVTALRRKLGEMGKIIETVRGVGYRLSDRAGVAAE
jgi:two-component system alkaline phosphatase synthesis response regulator PhoP